MIGYAASMTYEEAQEQRALELQSSVEDLEDALAVVAKALIAGAMIEPIYDRLALELEAAKERQSKIKEAAAFLTSRKSSRARRVSL